MTTLVNPAATDGRHNAEGRRMPVAKKPELTEREKELLRGVVADKTYAEIAYTMGLSYETVKSYAARIRGKLGINTKIGLALWAAKNL